MRTFLHLVFPAVMSLALVSGSARAQCGDDQRAQVETQIEFTDARIEQATPVVADSDNPRAHGELDLAVQIQGRAKSELGAMHCRMALDLTRDARDHVARALALIRGLPGSLPDRARLQLGRTAMIIERARDRIEECDNDRGRAMLRAGGEMQLRAEDAFAHDRFLAALQLTVSARERALRALRICNLQDDAQGVAERALRQTDQAITRAQERIAERGSDPARDALAHAVDLENRAWGEYRAGHFDASLRLAQTAGKAALRALQILGDVR